MAAKPNSNTPTFDCPSWAGMPPTGLHLDVVKGDKLVEKLIIDEKKYYLFGRNPDVCDVTIDHQSCSRIHSALVYHKHLRRVFIIDLNSTHGTFLGRIRLDPHKPQQVPLDSAMSFGASTRVYILREKPQSQGCAVPGEMKTGKDEELKGLLGLPEAEMELDNLTEFNTAHNKRLSTLTIEEGDLDIHRPKRKRRRRRSSHVSFSNEEEVINPEDVDPFVGHFRNLIQASVVPIKKHVVSSLWAVDAAVWRRPSPSVSGGLYGDLPLIGPGGSTPPTPPQAAASITRGLHVHLPKVDVSPTSAQTPVTLNPEPAPGPYAVEPLDEPHKKKYVKEAWPEKRPTLSLLT